MDLFSAMRIFIRVVERGSMSAAARDLGIGQPAVSERIEKLEAHLGTRLLRRNTRNMSLTQSGNVFYERSKTAVQAAEHALSVNGGKSGAARQNPYCRALFRWRKLADACIVAAPERASGAAGRCHF